jgi:alkanesulfonate monooxygenase SsuD/methylene tetrahydromethanopterin reductase-like flavin-dependent oxidoreductase (luciferase family)
MFRQEETTFRGAVHHVDGALNMPRPVRPGGPPILVGGGGERKTLRLAAQYADMWNGFGDLDVIRHKLDVLAQHCEAVGRDPSEIVTTRLTTLIVGQSSEDAERRRREWQEARGVDDETVQARLMWGDRKGAAEQARTFLAAGLGGLIFNMPAGSSAEDVLRAGEALAQLRD